jgi:hypothetical protein
VRLVLAWREEFSLVQVHDLADLHRRIVNPMTNGKISLKKRSILCDKRVLDVKLGKLVVTHGLLVVNWVKSVVLAGLSVVTPMS